MNTIDKFDNSGSTNQMEIIYLQADNVRVAAVVETVSAAAASASADTSAIKVNKAGDIMTRDLDIRLSEKKLANFRSYGCQFSGKNCLSVTCKSKRSN